MKNWITAIPGSLRILYLNNVLNRLFFFLAVKDNERNRLSICALFSFIIGLAQLFIVTAPLSLFLATYSTDLLPYIYIASAIATILFGFVTSYFQKKLEVLTLITGILYACSIVLFIFWTLLAFTSLKPVILFLIVCGLVIFELCNLMMTCIVGYLFTFEEGKRLNGIIASVRASGSVTAGLISPLVVYFINTKHIIAIIALTLCLAIVVFQKIKLNYFASAINHNSDDEDSQTVVKSKGPSLYKNTYLVLIFIFSALTIFEYYSLSMLFNQTVSMRYSNEDALTGFLGLFYSAVDIFSMVIGLYAFNKINEKLGVIFSLQLMPTIVGILIAIVIFISNFFPYLFTAIFILVLLTHLMDESLRTSFNDEIIGLLYLPLSDKERSMAQLHNGLFVTPAAMGIIGIILLIFSHTADISITKLGLMILVFSFLALIMLWPIKNKFKKILYAKLKKREITQMDFLSPDEITITKLKENLLSNRDIEVISTLSFFDKFNKTLLIAEFPNCLNHSSKTIQKYALKKIIEYKYKGSFYLISHIAKNSDNKEIKSLAIIALGIQRSDTSDNLLLDFLSQHDPLIMSSAIVGLTKYNSTKQVAAIEQLNHLLHSDANEEKILGTKIIGQSSRQDFAFDLLPLIKDANPVVRTAASEASINIMNKDLFIAIANNLPDKTTRKFHIQHLIKAKHKVVPLFINEFANLRKEIKSLVINIVDSLQATGIGSFILTHLDNRDNHVRHKIICILSKYNFSALPEKTNRRIIEQLRLEKNFINRLNIILNLISNLDKTDLAKSFLLRELALSKERMVNLLSCFYKQKQFLQILEAMQSGDKMLHDYAYELLFQLLTNKHKQEYFSYFKLDGTYLSGEEQVPNDEIMTSLITNVTITKTMFVISGTIAVILYCLSNVENIQAVLEGLPIDRSDGVQLETYNWIVSKRLGELN